MSFLDPGSNKSGIFKLPSNIFVYTTEMLAINCKILIILKDFHTMNLLFLGLVKAQL